MTLPTAAMGDVDLDPRGVLDFVRAQEDAGQDMTSVVVVRHGRLCAQAHWAPYRSADRRQVYSVTKTFTSMAVGIAVEAGALGYDDRVVDLLAAHVDPHDVGPAASRIRVRDCLAMATGHTVDLPHGFDALARSWSESLRPLLVPEPQAPLGTFHYSNLASYGLAAMVSTATGSTCAELVEEHVLRPLDIEVDWHRDELGGPLGYAGLHVRPVDLADLAQVIADGGCRDGERLVPQSWIDQATRVHADTSALTDHGPDWRHGYGWQLWRNRAGFRLDGAYGQFAVILPDQDLAVVVTEGAMEPQATLDHIWQHLVPACDRPASADEDAVRLALATRHIGTGCPTRDPEAPALADPVTLRLDATGPMLHWTEADQGETPLGLEGEWVRSRLRWGRRSLEIAGTAVVEGGEILATVAVLSQPHLINLRTQRGCGEPQAMWRTSPLGTHRLRDLALEDSA